MRMRKARRLKVGDRVWVRHVGAYVTITATEQTDPALKNEQGNHPLFRCEREGDEPPDYANVVDTYTYLAFRGRT